MPGVKLGFETIPPFQQHLLRNTQWACVDGVVGVQVNIITGTNEVDEFRENPNKRIGDEIFFHHVISFGVAVCAGVTGAHKSHVVKLGTSFSPQHQVVGVQPRVALIDNC